MILGKPNDPQVGIEILKRAVDIYGTRIKTNPLFQMYVDMVRKCYDPQHPSWYSEGAKGVQICDEWRNDFLVFAVDILSMPDAPREARRWYRKLSGRIAKRKLN